MRGVAGGFLVAMGAAALVLAAVAFWARGTIYDQASFRGIAVAAVRPEPVRRAMAAEVVHAMLGEDAATSPVAADLLTSTITGLLGSDTFRYVLDRAAELAWIAIVVRRDEDITVDATRLRDSALQILGDAFPRAAGRIENTPTPFVVTLAEAGTIPSLRAGHRKMTLAFVVLLAVSGLALAGAGFVVGGVRRLGVRAGVAVSIGSGLVLVVLLLASWWLSSLAGARGWGPAAGHILQTLTRDLAWPLGILAILGLALGVVGTEAHRELERNASRGGRPAPGDAGTGGQGG